MKISIRSLSPLLLSACLAFSLSGMANASPLPSASDQPFCLQQLSPLPSSPQQPSWNIIIPKQTCGACSWSICRGAQDFSICGTASNGQFKYCVDHGVCTDGTLYCSCDNNPS